MPRSPALSRPARAMPGTVFDRLLPRARAAGDPVLFHLGDSALLPPPAARYGELGDDEALYRYAANPGWLPLVAALSERLERDHGLGGGAARIQVTAGATSAMACTVRALCDPGDELILCAPYWPLMRGIAAAAEVRAIEVPFTSRLAAEPSLDPAALLAPHIGPRTAAIYLCSPNNPDGVVLTSAQLGAVAELARRHDLWLISDEIYAHAVFDGGRHAGVGALAAAADRTVSIFSFSKAYAMSGLRVGYAHGPEPVIAALRALSIHSAFSVPLAAQRQALAALAAGEGYLAMARAEYQAARDLACALLGVARPAGGAFLFLDLAARLGGAGDALPLLERLAERGVVLAPGSLCGRDFAHCARLCFTAHPRDRLEAGLRRLVAAL